VLEAQASNAQENSKLRSLFSQFDEKNYDVTGLLVTAFIYLF